MSQNPSKRYTLDDAKRDISEFNRDHDVQRLKEEFSQASIFDILKKSRDELSHSAFLAWFISETPKEVGLRGLLNIISRRALNQGKSFPQEFLVGKDVKLDAVVTEKPLPKKKDKSEGRIDIWIECSCEGTKYLIVIENKVDAPEHDDQTETYHKALSDKYLGRDVIYIFLKPASKIKMIEMEKKRKPECACEHFIQINYQDILEDILLPLVDSRTDVGERLRILTKEYINCLKGYKKDLI